MGDTTKLSCCSVMRKISTSANHLYKRAQINTELGNVGCKLDNVAIAACTTRKHIHMRSETLSMSLNRSAVSRLDGCVLVLY